MKTILTIATILITLGATAQGYLFVGVQGIKEAGVDYWCQNQTYETTPIASAEEYNALKKEFLDRKPTWPATWLLTPEQAAVIYEMNKKMDGFNCTRKGIGIAKGATIERAIEEMQKITSQCKECDPQILFRWDPKAKQKSFKNNLGGMDTEVTSKPKPGGGTEMEVKMTNTKNQQAMVALVKKEGQLLEEPQVVMPESTYHHMVPGSLPFYIYIDYNVDMNVKINEWIEVFKRWVKDYITTPPKTDKDGHIIREFDPACMCIRG